MGAVSPVHKPQLFKRTGQEYEKKKYEILLRLASDLERPCLKAGQFSGTVTLGLGLSTPSKEAEYKL